MPGLAGDLGDEQAVTIRYRTILIHPARIEHHYVKSNLNGGNQVGTVWSVRPIDASFSVLRVRTAALPGTPLRGGAAGRGRDDTGTVSGERSDFFVSHAGADRAWAEWVAWQLTEAGYTVELDVWDWARGPELRDRDE